jgi:hypothetical protein
MTAVSIGRLAVVMIIAGSTGLASAADRLASLLGCEQAPSPTQILLGFREAGLLGAAVETAAHNETCWPLEPALKYRGLQFVSVCAAVDRPEEILQHPKLYGGMSLAPYAGLWLEAHVNASTLYGWAKFTLPSRGHFEVHATDGGAVIACTGSWFPPPRAAARS